MYNVGLIGCGYMGQAHLEDSYFRPEINIYAVCDLSKSKADVIGKQFNADKIYYDPDELINDENIDIVIIATYPSSHLSLLKKCIKNNKHVICEKPVTDNLKDGYKFAKLVKENPQCKILIGYILRHNDTYLKVKSLIDNDVIGHPIIMRLVQNHHALNDWGKYKALIEETSPIIDCGVHYIDIMRWFTNEEVININGVGAVTEPGLSKDKYNYGMINVNLSGGSVGFYEAGWGHTIATNNLKEFIGPKGRIKITYQKDRETHKESGNLISIYRFSDNSTEFINMPFGKKPTGAELSHLIKMIEEDVPAVPTIDDVIKSFEIVTKANDKIVSNLKKNM